MTRLRWLIALPALLIATSGLSVASEINDKAGLFSTEAIKKAQKELDRIEREYKVPVTIETIESLKGDRIVDVVTRHADQDGAKGLYVMIAKTEHRIFTEPSKQYKTILTRDRCKAIDDAFTEQLKKRDFDAALSRGVAQIESTVASAKPAAKTRRAGGGVVGQPSSGGGLMMTLLFIGLGILALFVVIRILGAIFGGGNRGYAGQQRMGPGGGMGGPGYGPGYGGGMGGGGGGGFMSSMFGGIGGALAGNWLYDQFSGRHHDTSVGSSGYDPATGAAPPDAGPEWGTGGAEGDWGGSPADTGAAGGDWGGDAGGGGGGDWGGGDAGGGGGGDWGGGGGGDWGGGGGGDGGGW